MKKRLDKAAELKLTVQPYIVVVGSTITSVTDSYVVIDNHIYKVSSPLQALDFTFKAFHTLNAHYPKESEHIWQLMEKVIYSINAPGVEIPAVATIVQELANV